MENALLHQIDAGDQPMDIDFHPTRDILATGMINGTLLLHTCTKDSVVLQHTIKAHSKDHPCRAVQCTLSNDLILTGSTDKSILAIDINTGKASARKKDAHEAAINRLQAINETLTASGDEAGNIKIWDIRQSDAVADLSPHDDYVADIFIHSPEHALLSVSGDGTLAVTDIRAMDVIHNSEGDADDELLSVVVMKQGKKIVCGTTSGVVDIWSWGYWNDCSDRFPGHPDSVTSVVKYDEDTILTSSSDGLIRILSVQPNRMLGIVGEHSDMDVERLRKNGSTTLLASASHDNTVKIWNLSLLEEDDDDEEEEEEEDEEKEEERNAVNKKEDEESDDDSDEGDKRRKKKRKGEHKIQSKSAAVTHNFFSDIL